jgi:hypothetical protein
VLHPYQQRLDHVKQVPRVVGSFFPDHLDVSIRTPRRVITAS